MIGRRGFFKAIGAAVLGMSLALKAPENLIEPALRTDGLQWPTALKAGDLFVIDGVFSVNPITYAKTDHLQRFVVTADVSAGHVINEDLIYPKIVSEGIYQNVSDEPSPHARIGVFEYWPNNSTRHHWLINWGKLRG